MASMTEWLRCPTCRRSGGIAFELEEKSITVECAGCEHRDHIGFGFGWPIRFGPWDAIRAVDAFERGEIDHHEL